ncbi:hypothetical protein BGZ63DRAFT_201442 [Mariannaea sp. PMI_226]|nr:hypothetical protein BGZ63DRAFT_201442 [Mariannaea sp. PMI_226]
MRCLLTSVVFVLATATLAQEEPRGFHHKNSCEKWCLANFPLKAGLACASHGARGRGPCWECGPKCGSHHTKQLCGGKCVNTKTDKNNCGTCGTKCTSKCVNGSCSSDCLAKNQPCDIQNPGACCSGTCGVIDTAPGYFCY